MHRETAVVTETENVLLLVGGEICHNYFVNRIRSSHRGKADVVVCHSGRSDFEFYYPVYAVGEMDGAERDRIVDFIFRRNSSFARNEPYELLVRPQDAVVTRNSAEFNSAIGDLMSAGHYDAAFSYGVPIIRNAAVLAPDFAAFNLHIGLSRHYRGGDCNIFALAEGAVDRVGLTCHKLSEAVDEGAVLFEVAYPPSEGLASFDAVNHRLIADATDKVVAWLGGEQHAPYAVPKGRLVLNRELTARHILAAEDRLALMRRQ